MFGLNHKFAVNAPQCDIGNPVPSTLFPIPEAKPKNPHDKKESFVTVSEPFELMTDKRAGERNALKAHNFNNQRAVT